jgi:hypothetical protein
MSFEARVNTSDRLPNWVKTNAALLNESALPVGKRWCSVTNAL